MGAHANGTQGKRPVIIGVKTVSTTYGIVVGPHGNWPGADATFEEKMQSLKGKAIGVSAIGAGSDLQLDLALELAGMRSADVTHLAVGPSASAIPNMKAGRIDGYVSVQWSSGLFIAKETEGSVLLDFGGSSMPATLREQAVLCMSTSESFAEQNEDVLKRWLQAQWDGSEWMRSHKREAAEILNAGTFDGNAPEIAGAYLDHYAEAIAPNLQTMFKAPKDQIDHMIDLAVRFGNAKEGAISYEQIVPAFARA
jgi:ABC-type nitrate/sulfonate/bicarbonate transport system substrate-binding protein